MLLKLVGSPRVVLLEGADFHYHVTLPSISWNKSSHQISQDMKSEVLDSLFKLYDTRSRQCDSITFHKQERDPRFGILSLREASERRDLINLPCGLLLWPFKLWLMAVDVSFRVRAPSY